MVEKMTLKEAIETLKNHNEWRRGTEINMQSPKDIGIAIDIIINYFDTNEKAILASSGSFKNETK